MSKQNHEPRKIRSRNGLAPIARHPLSGDGNPFAFERQLAAMQRANQAPSPSRLHALYTRFVPCSFIQRSFIQRSFIQRAFIAPMQGLVKRLFNRRGRRRKLDIVDIQQLGEKRFVAILRVGKQKFLIGGAAGSVSLLAEIDARRVTPIAARSLGQESA
jgi:Flagellar biosynthesis protein, FliO